MQGYYAVKSLLHEVVDVRRVVIRDRIGFCGVLLDNNQQKTICRLRFNGTQKYLGLLDERREEKVRIDEVDDIYNYAERLIATVKYYEAEGASSVALVEAGRS